MRHWTQPECRAGAPERSQGSEEDLGGAGEHRHKASLWAAPRQHAQPPTAGSCAHLPPCDSLSTPDESHHWKMGALLQPPPHQGPGPPQPQPEGPWRRPPSYERDSATTRGMPLPQPISPRLREVDCPCHCHLVYLRCKERHLPLPNKARQPSVLPSPCSGIGPQMDPKLGKDPPLLATLLLPLPSFPMPAWDKRDWTLSPERLCPPRLIAQPQPTRQCPCSAGCSYCLRSVILGEQVTWLY
jgi:hypothetical protein